MLGSNSRRAARSVWSALSRTFAAESQGTAGACSGVPQEVFERKVLIFSPARSAGQQGKRGVGSWKISFGERQRWENPLMGWTSTADPLSHVGRSALEFDSEEAACEYASSQGWAYDVVKPNAQSLGSSVIRGAGKRGTRVKQYGDNFDNKRRGTPIWEAGQSGGTY